MQVVNVELNVDFNEPPRSDPLTNAVDEYLCMHRVWAIVSGYVVKYHKIYLDNSINNPDRDMLHKFAKDAKMDYSDVVLQLRTMYPPCERGQHLLYTAWRAPDLSARANETIHQCFADLYLKCRSFDYNPNDHRQNGLLIAAGAYKCFDPLAQLNDDKVVLFNYVSQLAGSFRSERPGLALCDWIISQFTSQYPIDWKIVCTHHRYTLNQSRGWFSEMLEYFCPSDKVLGVDYIDGWQVHKAMFMYNFITWDLANYNTHFVLESSESRCRYTNGVLNMMHDRIVAWRVFTDAIKGHLIAKASNYSSDISTNNDGRANNESSNDGRANNESGNDNKNISDSTKLKSD